MFNSKNINIQIFLFLLQYCVAYKCIISWVLWEWQQNSFITGENVQAKETVSPMKCPVCFVSLRFRYFMSKYFLGLLSSSAVILRAPEELSMFNFQLLWLIVITVDIANYTIVPYPTIPSHNLILFYVYCPCLIIQYKLPPPPPACNSIVCNFLIVPEDKQAILKETLFR